MSIESLSCTRCGSSQVQEVKPNTYFCAHCEEVFKQVDSSAVTVKHRPDFCSCGSGNPVFAQCQVCRDNVVCRRCDIGHLVHTSRHVFREAIEDQLGNIGVRTVGFGYQFEGFKPEVPRGNNVNLYPTSTPPWKQILHGRIVDLPKLPGDARLTSEKGLFLYASQLFVTVSASFGEKLSHLCFSCLAAAVPDTAEGLSAGSECEYPRHNYGPYIAGINPCLCCGRAYCRKHLTSAKPAPPAHKDDLSDTLYEVFIYDKDIFTIRFDQWVNRSRKEDSVSVETPRGLCADCGPEVRDKLVANIAEQYGDVLELLSVEAQPPRRYWTFKMSPARALFSAGQITKNSHVYRAAARLADELRIRAASIASEGTCTRAKDDDRYIIVDDRSVTPAAAASVVLPPR